MVAPQVSRVDVEHTIPSSGRGARDDGDVVTRIGQRGGQLVEVSLTAATDFGPCVRMRENDPQCNALASTVRRG
jgi:hypothetical protein